MFNQIILGFKLNDLGVGGTFLIWNIYGRTLIVLKINFIPKKTNNNWYLLKRNSNKIY